MSMKGEPLSGTTKSELHGVRSAAVRMLLNRTCTCLTSHLDQIQLLRSKESSLAEIESSLRQLNTDTAILSSVLSSIRTINSIEGVKSGTLNGVTLKEYLTHLKE